MNITKDGFYPVIPKDKGLGGDEAVAYISGEFGGATATLNTFIN